MALRETLNSPLLGGSCVVISGLISRVTIVMAHIYGPITPLITTHEPPSMVPIEVPVHKCLLRAPKPTTEPVFPVFGTAHGSWCPFT